MTLQLRPYQQAAIDALYGYFSLHTGNPLVVMPTGTGKSVVIAGFIREAIAAYGDTRAGPLAGEYLESIGKTDLARLTEAEWLTFLEVVVTAYQDALVRRLEAERTLRAGAAGALP